MGAPSCLVVLREARSPADLVGPWLQAFGRAGPDDDLGMTVVEARPADFGIADPEEEGVPRIGVSLESPTDAEFVAAVQRAAGWPPRQCVHLSGFTSAPYNHVLLGRVASALASRAQGLIQLGTVCILDETEQLDLPPEVQERIPDFVSRLHPEDRDDVVAVIAAAQSDPSMADVWTALSRRYDELVRRRLAGHPGRACELLRPDGVVDSFLVDSVFMEAWMKDPGFHIG